MSYKVITPAAPIVTLDEVRLHLRISPDTPGGTHPDDPLLSALILSAMQYCEHGTGRAIGTQTIELALDAFPEGAISLPKGPLQSISSVAYTDATGAAQTISSALYAIDDYGFQPWVLAKANNGWPPTYASANAVRVKYIAGSKEPIIVSAVLLMVGHLYENREATNVGRANADQELPLGVKSLLNTVKVWGI